MAVSFDYPSYAEMCLDLGYTGRSFNVAIYKVDEQAEVQDQGEYRKQAAKDIARTALNAFKFSRR